MAGHIPGESPSDLGPTVMADLPWVHNRLQWLNVGGCFSHAGAAIEWKVAWQPALEEAAAGRRLDGREG